MHCFAYLPTWSLLKELIKFYIVLISSTACGGKLPGVPKGIRGGKPIGQIRPPPN